MGDALLIQGIAHTGRDSRAIAWVLDELQRRREESARTDAQKAEAKAIADLAAALKSETDRAVLDKLLPRLTERTRFAVLAQLKDGGR
jgi:hypothetical protein